MITNLVVVITPIVFCYTTYKILKLPVIKNASEIIIHIGLFKIHITK